MDAKLTFKEKDSKNKQGGISLLNAESQELNKKLRI